MSRLSAGLVAISLLALPALAQETAKGTFLNTKGDSIGTATLTQTPQGVLVDVEVKGVPKGEHAFHIHETGQCDPKTGFKSAGGHYDPRGHQHGYKSEKGPHAGDMPNQFVPDSDILRAEVFNPNVTLKSGTGSLFDNDGSAIVIHAKADDYSSQPAGDAGDRIACAVVEK